MPGRRRGGRHRRHGDAIGTATLPADRDAWRTIQHRPFRGIPPRGLPAPNLLFRFLRSYSDDAPIPRGHARGAHAHAAGSPCPPLPFRFHIYAATTLSPSLPRSIHPSISSSSSSIIIQEEAQPWRASTRRRVRGSTRSRV
jgi:hypothetical protein